MWVAGLEQPEYLPYHQRPECWLTATDPLQQSNTGVEGLFLDSFLRLGRWVAGLEVPEYLPYSTRGQAAGFLQLIHCSIATQE